MFFLAIRILQQSCSSPTPIELLCKKGKMLDKHNGNQKGEASIKMPTN